MATDPQNQHATFNLAVAALGGPRSAARAIEISERTMAHLVSGTRPLHDGFLRDVAKALLQHAEICRELEKRLNPLFSGNLTEEQRREDGRRTRHLTPGGE